MVQAYIQAAIEEHKLDTDFDHTVEAWYKPLANRLADVRAGQSSTLVVGVQGTQGSGKSTLADFLRRILHHEHELNCVVCSIDDFYLTKAERLNLSAMVHPLLKTRGVPGTHDVDLALKVIRDLSQLDSGKTALIPRFDKALDDRSDISEWTEASGPIDIILLEGWCVGLPPQEEATLTEPVNYLEAEEDVEGEWRRYVNRRLGQDYKELFALLDFMVVINAPSFGVVFEWRLLQEQKLAQKLQEDGRVDETEKLLTGQQVKRFIAHYQRLTEHALDVMPKVADWVMFLDVNHNIVSSSEQSAS